MSQEAETAHGERDAFLREQGLLVLQGMVSRLEDVAHIADRRSEQ